MEMIGSSEESGMPKEKEVFDFESISMSVLVKVKLILVEELSAKISKNILGWLKKIEDEGRRIEELSEFQNQIQWILGEPIHINSGKIEDLAPQVGSLAGKISMSMVTMLTPKPTDPNFVSSLLLYTKQIDPLCELMENLVKSFSTAEKEGVNDPARSNFTDERNLICLSKLKSISSCIGKLFDEKEMNSKGEIDEKCVMGREEQQERSTTRIDVEDFDAYRSSWELLRGPTRQFEEMTLLSPMVFTHCTPGHIPRDAVVGSTLQIYSVKVVEVDGAGLSWPLKVYGVVAARDSVDSSRNPIFLRPRHKCQMLTLQDPFLHLMGPSRAILSADPLIIEIQLKVKGKSKSEDRKLISKVCHYNGESSGILLVKDNHCAIEVRCEQVKQSIQATLSRARVVEQGSLPSQYGGRVLCCALAEGVVEDDTKNQFEHILMLDSRDGAMPMGKHQCLHLSRSVVAVELKGTLKVTVEARAPSVGTITGNVLFTPKNCSITKSICSLGDSKVEFTVAWSLLPSSKKC